jgi:hypothetical protein
MKVGNPNWGVFPHIILSSQAFHRHVVMNIDDELGDGYFSFRTLELCNPYGPGGPMRTRLKD